MAAKISIRDFNIDINAVPQDVKDLYNSMSKLRKSKLEKRYASGYDFVVILYHLIFVEKLEKSEIAPKLGIQVVNVHERLYDFGWNYSNDYAQNKILSEEELARLRVDLAEAREKSRLLDENEHIKLREAMEKVQNIRKSSWSHLGFNTKEEYARTIYYLISIKHFSPKNLVRLFDITLSTAHTRLQNLGFNISHDEGIKIKKEQGTHNYQVSLNRKKITTAKSQRKNFSTGSKMEDYCRIQISNMMGQYLESGEYEVVVTRM
jgi:hypothetical protein